MTFGPSSDDYAIKFQQLRSEVKSGYPIRHRSSMVTSVEVSHDMLRIVLKIRDKGSLISSTFLPSDPPRADHYRLVVDVFQKKAPKSSENSGQTASRGQAPSPDGVKQTESNKSEKKEEVTLPTIQEPEQPQIPQAELPESLKTAGGKFVERDYQSAYDLYAQFLKHSTGGNNEVAAALYGLADSYYSMHKNELQKEANGVLTRYLQALESCPAAPQAPWALYRCSQAYEALENSKQAIESFQQIVQNYPKHPAAALSWLSLGKIYKKNKSYVEAIQAFRSALQGPLEKNDSIQANWHLGECLYFIGHHAKAKEALERCLVEATDFYTKEPIILKYLAESFFVGKEYVKSRDYLLWYLNLKSEAEDKDLILARIAEIFLVQDEPMLANKLHHFIQTNLPDSEGNVICKIRKAEYLERKDSKNHEESLAIYQELIQKDLPVPLARLVRFKYALWHYAHHNFEESYNVIDDVLRASNGKVPMDDFMELRKKVVIDWSKSSFEKKDYAQVIRLYEANNKIFGEAGLSDLESMVGDSYGKLKLCKKAVAIFQQIMEKETGPKKEEFLLKIALHTFLGGEFDKAVQLIDTVKASSLGQQKTLLLARIYFAQKNYSKAIECFNSVQGKTKTPISLENEYIGIYGESLMYVGEYEKALPWLQKALEELKKNDPRPEELVHFYVAESACYRELKKNENAVNALEEAVSVANSEEIKNQLNYDIANLYLAAGKRDKAAQKLTKLLGSQQDFWQTAAKQQLGYIQLQKR